MPDSLKLLVTIKRTPQRDARIRLATDGSSLDLASVAYEVNPFDELAVEEALKLKEAHGGEVVVVTVGTEASDAEIISALAMGADRAIRVETTEELDSLQIARCLAAVVQREAPDLVLSGKLAVDDEACQVPGMLAALLDWPLASQASALDIAGNTARVTCEVDTGLEDFELDLPAIVTADLRLNEPRYASLPGRMKAKKKPREVLPAAELCDVGPRRIRVTGFSALPQRPPGVTVGSVAELVEALSARKLV